MKINIYKILYNREKKLKKAHTEADKGKKEIYSNITQVPKRRLLVNSWVLWARLPESHDLRPKDLRPNTKDPRPIGRKSSKWCRKSTNPQNDDVRMDNKMKTNFDKVNFK